MIIKSAFILIAYNLKLQIELVHRHLINRPIINKSNYTFVYVFMT